MSTPVTVIFIGKPIFYQRENNDLCRESFNRSSNYADFLGISGGWLLIFNVVIDSSSSLPPITTQDDYRKIGDYQSKALILTNNALFELQKHLAFKELRFHCYKPGARTFHVVTITNSTGESVIHYFTGQVAEFPKASGSFTRLRETIRTSHFALPIGDRRVPGLRLESGPIKGKRHCGIVLPLLKMMLIGF